MTSVPDKGATDPMRAQRVKQTELARAEPAGKRFITGKVIL